MRPDQIEQLRELTESLADVFITEADPKNWPGAALDIADWTPAIRGDRHWTKKNAMSTGGVLRYTLDMIRTQEDRAARPGADEDQPAREADLDASIRDAQKRAAEAIARATIGKAKGKEASLFRHPTTRR